MAGGGITSLQNRPGYFLGGVGDFFGGIKDKIVDDLIPNEIKDSPVGTALVGGALLNQFGIPFTGTPGDRMGQNWLGDLLGNISPNLSDMVIGPGGSEYSTTRPSGMDVGYSLDDLISGGGIGGAVNQGTGMDRIMDIAMNRTPYGQSIAGFQDARPTWQKALDVVQNVVTGGPDTTPDASGRYPIRWKEPLAIGTAIGAADYLTRSDDKMPEQLSIDPSRFATAEAAKADPLLRFKPQEQYTLKEGGRIGYDNGGITKLASHEGNDAFLEQRYEHYLEQGFSPRKAAEQAQKDLMEGNYQDLAQGGRIGYDMGKLVDPKIPDTETIIKNLEEFLKKRKDYEDRIMRAPKQSAAEGGLMNLGGMEKDYRQEGGFVPIGGQEKADDVPARLSKNEFVFTADAVRAAGGGDIDAGAEVMENLMENLEAGGKVSEESQGLEGAREMFANAQRLQNRII